MAEDDLFSRLFELFNQPGPVNWKLAGEVARHMAGESQAIDPWAAEQIVELGGLAQASLDNEAPFPVPVLAVSVLDPREWVNQALESFGYAAEAIAEATVNTVPGMGAALAGMQVGTLVGGIASGTAASFEAGLPMEGSPRLLIVGPGVERLQKNIGVDVREVRLGVVASEIAHSALFRVPWLTEHLSRLLGAYAVHLVPDPEKLMEVWGGDPASLAERLSDPEALEKLVGGDEGTNHRLAVEAFLAITSGYRRFLVARSLPNMLPSLERLHSPAPAEAPLLTIPVADPGLTSRGARFCEEIEKGYGREAVDSIWAGPERLPSDDELEDATGWAARVLLDDLSTDY